MEGSQGNNDNYVVNFESNKIVLEKKKKEIIKMIIDGLKHEKDAYFRDSFESYLINKPLTYFKNKSHFSKTMLNELRHSTDLIERQLYCVIESAFYL